MILPVLNCSVHDHRFLFDIDRPTHINTSVLRINTLGSDM